MYAVPYHPLLDELVKTFFNHSIMPESRRKGMTKERETLVDLVGNLRRRERENGREMEEGENMAKRRLEEE